MTQITSSRRNFIKLTVASAAGGALNWDAASYARVLGSNDASASASSVFPSARWRR